jgi:hypothetical protein
MDLKNVDRNDVDQALAVMSPAPECTESKRADVGIEELMNYCAKKKNYI